MSANRRGFLKWLGIGSAAAPAVATGIVHSVSDAQADLAKQLPKGFKDPFHIPAEIIPKGVTYNWKRVFITPDVPDLENLVAVMTRGWTPVPAYRHRDQFLDYRTMRGWIEISGLVLMEKPIARPA
jgi:hypothetical protein